MMNEHVHKIMTKNPFFIGPEDNLETAYSIFLGKRIHNLPVIHNNKLVGMISTDDLWLLKKPTSEMGKTKIAEVMTKRIARISPNDKIGTAAELLFDPRLFALPVVDENDALVGIVTYYDILKYEFQREYKKPILYKEVFDTNYGVAV